MTQWQQASVHQLLLQRHLVFAAKNHCKQDDRLQFEVIKWQIARGSLEKFPQVTRGKSLNRQICSSIFPISFVFFPLLSDLLSYLFFFWIIIMQLTIQILLYLFPKHSVDLNTCLYARLTRVKHKHMHPSLYLLIDWIDCQHRFYLV